MKSFRRSLLLFLAAFVGISSALAQEKLMDVKANRLYQLPKSVVKNKKIIARSDIAFKEVGLELVEIGFRKHPYRKKNELKVVFVAGETGVEMEVGAVLKGQDGIIYWQSYYMGIKQPMQGKRIPISFGFDKKLMENSELTIWAIKPIVPVAFEMWEWMDEPDSKWLEPEKVSESAEEVVEEQKIYDVKDEVDQIPEFPGGEKAMLKFIYKNIRYPADARENGIQGIIVIQMIISEEGEISGTKILREIGGGCGEEGIRVINSMPNWKPAMKDGKPVPMKYNIPLRFKLS